MDDSSKSCYQIEFEDLIQCKPSTIENLKFSLQTRGWCFINPPSSLKQDIKRLLNSSEYFFRRTDVKAEYAMMECDRYGYVKSQGRESFRLLTGNFIKTFNVKIPGELNYLIKLSSEIDSISKTIIEKTGIFPSEKELLEKGVTLYKQPEEGKTPLSSYTMLDLVKYDQNDGMVVSEHCDPGLFAISLGSNEEGLQMLDPSTNEYLDVPKDSFVIWLGSTILEFNSYNFGQLGWHRVTQCKKDRITAWFEVCVESQIPLALRDIEEFKKIVLPSSVPRIITMKVRTLTGKTIECNVKSSGIIHDLMVEIQNKEGIPPDKMRLAYNGKGVDPNYPISHYGMKDGDMIYLVLRLRDV